MDEEKKVYIGNLKFELKEEELRKTIEEKDLKVVDVKIITDKFSGRSKGFGFAEFETAEEAQRAIDLLNEQELDGRQLRVSKAQKMKPKRDNFNNDRGGYNSPSRY